MMSRTLLVLIMLAAMFCAEANRDIAKMKVKELRQMLDERGVECKGCAEKLHLIQRVKETMHMPVIKKKFPQQTPNTDGRDPGLLGALDGITKEQFFAQMQNGEAGKLNLDAAQMNKMWDSFSKDMASGKFNEKLSTALDANDKKMQNEPNTRIIMLLALIAATGMQMYLRRNRNMKKAEKYELELKEELKASGQLVTAAGEEERHEDMESAIVETIKQVLHDDTELLEGYSSRLQTRDTLRNKGKPQGQIDQATKAAKSFFQSSLAKSPQEVQELAMRKVEEMFQEKQQARGFGDATRVDANKKAEKVD